MKRVNKRDARKTGSSAYSKNVKKTKEYEVFTQVIKIRVNEITERENKEEESHSNNWSQNLVEEHQTIFRDKYLERMNSTSFNSNFPGYCNNQCNYSENPNEQEEDKVDEIHVDHVDQVESHDQLDSNSDSEFININEVINMEVDDSPLSEENKEVPHFQDFTLNNVSELININEVKAVKAQKICMTPNCEKPHKAKGYCLSCYYKYVHKENKKKCKGCRLLKPHKAKGYCKSCYYKYVHKEKKIKCNDCGLLKPPSAKGFCDVCYRKNVHYEKKIKCNDCGLLKPHHGKGFCDVCYRKNVRLENKRKCNECQLLKPNYAKGYCESCYNKNARLEKKKNK